MKFLDSASVVPLRALSIVHRVHVDTVERAVRDAGVAFTRAPNNRRYLTPRQAEKVSAQLDKRARERSRRG